MLFSCTGCGTRYRIEDEKVRGRALKIRCRGCGDAFTVKGPPRQDPFVAEPTRKVSAAEALEMARRHEEETRAADAITRTVPRSEAQALIEEALAASDYHVILDGEQLGPLSRRALERLATEGRLDAQTWVWREGLEQWRTIAEVEELSPLVVPAETAETVETVETVETETAESPAPATDPMPFAGPEPAPPAPEIDTAAPTVAARRPARRLWAIVLMAALLTAAVALAGSLLLAEEPAAEAQAEVADS